MTYILSSWAPLVATIQSLSAHADFIDLINWFARIERKPTTVFLNHGCPESLNTLAKKMSERFQNSTFVPILKPQKINL